MCCTTLPLFSSTIRYRISSKSHHGKILFQGPVWCCDNLRAMRSTRTCVHSFNNKPIACTYIMHIRIRILLSTLYHVASFRGWHLLGRVGRNMQRYFEGGSAVRFQGDMVYMKFTPTCFSVLEIVVNLQMLINLSRSILQLYNKQ